MYVCAFQLEIPEVVGGQQTAIHKMQPPLKRLVDEMIFFESLRYLPKEDVGFLGHNDLFHGSVLSWHICILLPAAG